MAPKKIEEQYLHGIVRLVILFLMTEQAPQSQENLLQIPIPSQKFLQHNAALVQHACQASCFPKRSYLGANSLSRYHDSFSRQFGGWVKIDCAWTIPTGVQDMLWL